MTVVDGYSTTRATCVLAPNPSPMTLDGTNTWVVTEPGSSAALVIDPGPLDSGHLERVLAVAGDRRVALILLTHGHPDHSAGAASFAEMTGAPVRSAAAGSLSDGDLVEAGGCSLFAVATPGHSDDSVSLLLPSDGALFTGDTVLGRGTTVIAPDGNLADYLRTLDQLRSFIDDRDVGLLLPGHGPVVSDPAAVLDYYIAHRAERLDQIRAAIAAGARDAAEIVATVYADVDPSLRPAAEASVRAQLTYLRDAT